jgi:hypothetical protein
MSCRVSGPDDEVNFIPDILRDPFQCFVHKCERTVTLAGLCTIDTCRTCPSMTGAIFAG